MGLPGCSKSDVSNQWPAVSFQKRHQKIPEITEDAKLSPACVCAMPCATIELKLAIFTYVTLPPLHGISCLHDLLTREQESVSVQDNTAGKNTVRPRTMRRRPDPPLVLKQQGRNKSTGRRRRQLGSAAPHYRHRSRQKSATAFEWAGFIF